MPLPKPRDGDVLEFHSFPRVSYEVTLADPETVIWSSLRHLCAIGFSDGILYAIHDIKNKKLRSKISTNLKLYINHAFNFYEAGKLCQKNTAPLFYYYCFLHLAKALCEIKNPNFHRKRESYRHGISWRPNPKYVVDIPSEEIFIAGRGVWHILYETIINQQNIRIPHCKLSIKDLFSLCPEISIEFQRIFGDKTSRIELIDPLFLYNPKNNDVWIRFSINRSSNRKLRISRHNFIQSIKSEDVTYEQVKSDDNELWTFESNPPKKYQNYNQSILDSLMPELRKLNLYSVLDIDSLQYYISIYRKIPFQIPQIIVLYSLIFWLGSLVRYDPHSLSVLQDSEYWIIIDGFINQSVIWLLELFEWEFYQAETILRMAR